MTPGLPCAGFAEDPGHLPCQRLDAINKAPVGLSPKQRSAGF